MPKRTNEILPLITRLISAWSRGDVDEAMRYMDPDIEYFINVDPDVAPFAASTIGAPALKERMRVLLDTFAIESIIAKEIKISDDDPSVARVNIEYVYRERKTNARLEGCFRLIYYTSGGMITRIEKIHDSHYVEAFARLVSMMRETADDEL